MSFFDWINGFRINAEYIYLGLVLISVSLIFATIFMVVIGSRSPLKQKLDIIRKDSANTQTRKNYRMGRSLESLAPIFTPSNSKERESTRHQLMHAGYYDSSSLTTFYMLKALSLGTGVTIGASVYFFLPDISNVNIIILISISAGLFLPNIGLNYLVNKRQSRVRSAIPDALDLLVVCTESGLGFNAALRKVADELAISHPDFADELDIVCVKIKAGVQMSDALQSLVERTGISEISGLVSMLTHAARIGGSLGQTLREYNEDYRDRRNQEVEEIAAKIPTKMIFPLLLFIWPCFFIVAIGPSMLFLTATLGK